MIKSQERIDSVLRADRTKLKFLYFSIVLNTIVLELNFTKKKNQIPIKYQTQHNYLLGKPLKH